MSADNQIFNALVEFFEEDEWEFHWIDGTSVLSMGFTGKNGRWMCYAQAREHQEQFVFYSVCPVNVPEERRPAVSEFITRANYGMIIGNFELDYNDGEVRYKTSIDVEGDTLRPALIKQMVYANVIIMDRYLPGLMRVIYGNATPIEEIQQIEGNEPSARNVLDVPDDAPYVGQDVKDDDISAAIDAAIDAALKGDDDDDLDDEDDGDESNPRLDGTNL